MSCSTLGLDDQPGLALLLAVCPTVSTQSEHSHSLRRQSWGYLIWSRLHILRMMALNPEKGMNSQGQQKNLKSRFLHFLGGGATGIERSWAAGLTSATSHLRPFAPPLGPFYLFMEAQN